MKNYEKFKTAQERAEAMHEWCNEKWCESCVLHEHGIKTVECAFNWLDLEAEEEKPETIDEVIDDMRKVVEMMRKKESGGETLLDVSVIFDKFLNRIIAAHNRVAKKCMEGKE